MKKITTVIITAALAAGLCACTAPAPQVPASAGSESTAASVQEASASSAPAEAAGTAEDHSAGIRESYDKAIEYIETLMDTAEMTKNTQEEDPNYLYASWDNAGNEINTVLDREVLVDGKKLVVGETTVKELESFGFEVEKLAETAAPDETVGIAIKKDGKTTSLTLRRNDTGKEVQLEELPVDVFTSGSPEVCLPFEYSGLDAQCTFEDVLNALGEPNEMISLTADEMTAELAMVYADSEAENGRRARLEFNFRYDAEKNDASFERILLSVEEF